MKNSLVDSGSDHPLIVAMGCVFVYCAELGADWGNTSIETITFAQKQSHLLNAPVIFRFSVAISRRVLSRPARAPLGQVLQYRLIAKIGRVHS